MNIKNTKQRVAEPTDLDERLLKDYPELHVLSNLKHENAYRNALTASAAYLNLRTVERCLPDVEAGKHTIDIEYHIDLVVQALGKLARIAGYDHFVSVEIPRCDEVARKAHELIGDKVRGTDGRYT